MAATPTKLLTFEEYQQIADPPGGRYELFHGELVTVAEPSFRHVDTQWMLQSLLQGAAGKNGRVYVELPYRPLPEHEAWRADVAYVTSERLRSIERHLMGAPELVIEVLSPSNRAAELADKRNICFANGAHQFWLVYLDIRQVDVSTPDGRTISYKSGDRIPLFFAPATTIAVDDIFAA